MKKTLIITSWSPPMIGGPQNLYNLFSQYPADDYAILTSAQAIDRTAGTTGTWLKGQYYYYDQLGPWHVPRGESSTAKATLAQKLLGATKTVPLIGSSFGELGSMVYSILAFIRRGRRIVKEMNYSLVMGISDTGPALIATYFIARLTNRPFVYYLYDIYKGNNLHPVRRFFANIFEPIIFKAADLIILTNEGTEDFYHRRYGSSIRTAVVHNSVFGKNYEEQRTPYKPQAPYTILFTGHVYWAQEQSVMNLVKAMEQLTDIPVTLEMYVPKPDPKLVRAVAGKSNILLTSATQAEMPKIQSRATLLFLPLAWHTKSPDIIATATPGKFTDYLASGRPMLVHAPDYAYVARYTKEHALGLVVDEDNVANLAQTIRQYLSNPDRGRDYIERALEVFYRHHDATKNAKKLESLLSDV